MLSLAELESLKNSYNQSHQKNPDKALAGYQSLIDAILSHKGGKDDDFCCLAITCASNYVAVMLNINDKDDKHIDSLKSMLERLIDFYPHYFTGEQSKESSDNKKNSDAEETRKTGKASLPEMIRQRVNKLSFNAARFFRDNKDDEMAIYYSYFGDDQNCINLNKKLKKKYFLTVTGKDYSEDFHLPFRLESDTRGIIVRNGKVPIKPRTPLGKYPGDFQLNKKMFNHNKADDVFNYKGGYWSPTKKNNGVPTYMSDGPPLVAIDAEKQVVALYDINPGQELSFDYGAEHKVKWHPNYIMTKEQKKYLSKWLEKFDSKRKNGHGIELRELLVLHFISWTPMVMCWLATKAEQKPRWLTQDNVVFLNSLMSKQYSDGEIQEKPIVAHLFFKHFNTLLSQELNRGALDHFSKPIEVYNHVIEKWFNSEPLQKQPLTCAQCVNCLQQYFILIEASRKFSEKITQKRYEEFKTYYENNIITTGYAKLYPDFPFLLATIRLSLLEKEIGVVKNKILGDQFTGLPQSNFFQSSNQTTSAIDSSNLVNLVLQVHEDLIGIGKNEQFYNRFLLPASQSKYINIWSRLFELVCMLLKLSIFTNNTDSLIDNLQPFINSVYIQQLENESLITTISEATFDSRSQINQEIEKLNRPKMAC